MRPRQTLMVLCALVNLLFDAAVAAPARGIFPQGPAALGALVGNWQSDTVNGVAAYAACSWTQQRSAVVCEQRINSATSNSNALNVFTADSAHGQYALYALSPPGRVVTPVPITIRGALWYYGGTAPERDGRYYRTVNDFSRADVYTWRQETSPDGKQWTAGVHGQSRRIP
jgi:hypothetical protein